MSEIIHKKDFIGKTIVKVNSDSVNYLEFTFDDGTVAAIEVAYMGHNIYGIESTPVHKG